MVILSIIGRFSKCVHFVTLPKLAVFQMKCRTTGPTHLSPTRAACGASSGKPSVRSLGIEYNYSLPVSSTGLSPFAAALDTGPLSSLRGVVEVPRAQLLVRRARMSWRLAQIGHKEVRYPTPKAGSLVQSGTVGVVVHPGKFPIPVPPSPTSSVPSAIWTQPLASFMSHPPSVSRLPYQTLHRLPILPSVRHPPPPPPPTLDSLTATQYTLCATYSRFIHRTTVITF